MTKKALVLSGSPRKNGNTEFIIQNLLGYFSDDVEVEKFIVSDMNISPCKDCGFCSRSKGCVIQDDMQILYKKFDETDIVIISSPLYFNNVSAQLKMVIDRCQAIWSSKYILKDSIINSDKKRLGHFICTAGCKNVDFSGTLSVMDLFFKSINTNYLGNSLFDDTDNIPISNREINLIEVAKNISS